MYNIVIISEGMGKYKSKCETNARMKRRLQQGKGVNNRLC